MGTGYTRNDTGNNIASGNTIDAADLDGEFDAIEDAFDETTGHTHDGTSDEGAPVTVLGPAQEYVGDGTSLSPKTDDTYDLGTASLKWKDVYVDGIAYLDGVQIAQQTPSSASDTGVANTIAFDTDYIYICTATNTWKRVAIATW